MCSSQEAIEYHLFSALGFTDVITKEMCSELAKLRVLKTWKKQRY